MLAAMLTIVLVAIVLALVQDGEFDVIPAEEPVYTCAWGPAAAATPNNPCVPDALNTSDHVPGGCMVRHGELRGSGSDVGGPTGEREGHFRASGCSTRSRTSSTIPTPLGRRCFTAAPPIGCGCHRNHGRQYARDKTGTTRSL